MLSLFEKRKQKGVEQNAVENRGAVKFVQICLRLQEQCAAFLSRKAETLSPTAKSQLLLSFCVLSIGCSIYLITGGSINNRPDSFIVPIKLPKHTLQPHRDRQLSLAVTKEDFERIQQFRQLLDSLKQTPPGRKVCDSIMRSRPQLMDSLHLIENLYQLQKIKN